MLSIQVPFQPTPEQMREIMGVLMKIAGAKVMTAVAASYKAPEADGPTAAEAFSGKQPVQVAAPLVPFVAPGPVLLDKAGMPWDIRIHASTKAVTKDGSWKFRKGLDDATKNAVTAELRVRYPATIASVPQAAAPPPPPVQQPQLQTAVAPPPPPGGTEPTDFMTLMKKFGPLILAKNQGGRGITNDNLSQAAQLVGLATWAQLAQRSDLVPQVNAFLDSMVS